MTRPHLVWHEGALGDLLLLRLALAALRESVSAPLGLCARNEARWLFHEAGLVDQTFGTAYGPQNLLSTLKPTRIFLFGGKHLLPLFEGFKGEVLLVPTRPSGRRHLALEQFFTVAQGLGQRAEIILERALSRGLVLLEGQRSGPILFHPGSGGRWKCAPLSVSLKIAQGLRACGLPVRLILGPAEEDLLPALQGENFILCRSLEEAVFALKGARGFLGYDSGLSHLAAALGLPTVALFGPTPWWHWSPFGRQVLVLYRPCSCLKKGLDPRGCQAPCLAKLPQTEVVAQAEAFFNTTAKSPRKTLTEGKPPLTKEFRPATELWPATGPEMGEPSPEEYRWLGVAVAEVV